MEEKSIVAIVAFCVGFTMLFFGFAVYRCDGNDRETMWRKAEKYKACLSAGFAPERCAAYDKMSY